MARILWNDYFSVNDDFIDRQNQKMIAIINDFYESIQKGSSVSVIESILNRLVDYANAQHPYEEELMKFINYSELEAHHQAHIDFNKRLMNEYHKYQQNHSAYPVHTLSTFLKEWLVNHILQVDKKFAPHIK
ncbi:MAG: hemerythrin family protein [Candidatus Marinimicrobia bacterium]|nr:hemerythrin family protein [Candidatus Neomarinimicrobiota bacterium]